MTIDTLRTPTAAAAERTAPEHRTARIPFRLLTIFLVLLVAAVPWRSGVYYEGGADAVVLAKAALTGFAFALAMTVPAPTDSWSRLRATPAIWMTIYLALACISGLIEGSQPAASVILAVRLALLAAVLILVVRAYQWSSVVATLTMSMLVLVVSASLTGLPSLSEGRLSGGLPPVSPNETALLASVPAIVIMWAWLNHETSWRFAIALPVLLGLVWATGSRTGFAALVIALLALGLSARRIPMPAFVAAVLALPAAVLVTGWTTVVSNFVERGGTEGLTTLNSRTVAWSSAVEYADTTTERLIGAGLALKQIPVSAMYREEQIVDSTWVSALIQVGVIGIVVLALFVLLALAAAARAPQPRRSLYVALILYSLLTSFLESGMFDGTVAFIVFFTVALCAHQTRAADTS